MARKKSSVKKASASKSSLPNKSQSSTNGTTKSSLKKKSTSRRSRSVEETVGVSPVDISTNQTSFFARKYPIKRSYIIAVIAAIVVLLAVYSSRSLIVAAVVNGTPIYRLSVIHTLEQQSGDQALQSLITQTLIQDEANKQNVSVSQSDINNQLKTIQANLSKSGQTLDAALTAQHMTMQQLQDQIRLQLLVQKMVGKVTVSDKQAQDYMSQNKDSFPAGTKISQVKQQLQQQQLQQKEQSFVSDLQNKAKISYWVTY